MRQSTLNEEAIFHVARRIEQADARTAYLNQVCGRDWLLYDRVVELLGLPGESEHFLESPPSVCSSEVSDTLNQSIDARALSTVSERRSTDPRRIATSVHGELDWIVMKALEKDRNRRYESASAFAADVEHYLNDEAVHACLPSMPYRFQPGGSAQLCLVLPKSIVSPDGKTLAFQIQTSVVQRLDLATGRLRELRTGHNNGAICLAYSPDGQTLATGSLDRRIKLWTPARIRKPQTSVDIREV